VRYSKSAEEVAEAGTGLEDRVGLVRIGSMEPGRTFILGGECWQVVSQSPGATGFKRLLARERTVRTLPAGTMVWE
jgi:hypothetical protein